MNNVIELLDSLKLPYMERGNEHCREGWVQISCPFCPGGDHDYHLGINIRGAYTSCYRCGFHSIESLLRITAGVYYKEAQAIKRRYFKTVSTENLPETGLKCKEFILPSSGAVKDSPWAYVYLKKRLKQRTDACIAAYGLTYTAGTYAYEHPTTEHRYKYTSCIVIPNTYNGKAVSFQCRSYLPGVKNYITAKPEEELIHHKHFLWGQDLVPLDTVIVVEGAFNAMSIGPGAVHTHGCQFTKNQVDELSTFKTVYLAYDKDKAGGLAWRKMFSELGHKTTVYKLEYGKHLSGVKDPNDLVQTEEGRKELTEMQNLVQ